jgi:N,N-dimethylformamidase
MTSAAELTGYADQLSVSPGEPIAFMVSTSEDSYQATIVQLVHGDTNRRGPGFKERVIENTVAGEFPGNSQQTRSGSYVLVPDSRELDLESFTLQAWALPTRPLSGRFQGLISRVNEGDGCGFGLFINPTGALSLLLSDGDRSVWLVNKTPVEQREWTFVAGSFDRASGMARLYTQRISRWGGQKIEMTGCPATFRAGPTACSVRIGSSTYAGPDTAEQSSYDGKIDRPRVFGRALTTGEIQRLAEGSAPADVASGSFYAAWDFGTDQSGIEIPDLGPAAIHGVVVNQPTRGVTGFNWSGNECDFRLRPDEYSAIHFHADDLEDAAWDRSIECQVPPQLKSGIYALRLRSGDLEDHIPFIVRSPSVGTDRKVVFLLPTMTYLAYANERMGDPMQPNSPPEWPSVPDPLDHFLNRHPEYGKSLYDLHDDGSGVCYSSARRPIPSLRPNYRFRFLDAPRHLGADLYVTDWLEHIDVACDVITDHDLDAGRVALDPYRTLITGNHPEYMSAEMISVLETWIENGGRIMYLGGNGCYWVTSVHPHLPHVIEVRRGMAGSRPWETEPGELHHSTTGELGGLWRHRGKLPNRLFGVGFAAEGVDATPVGYERTRASFAPANAWVFEGVTTDTIGIGGLVLQGAAGDEVDRADWALGSPVETTILAMAQGFGASYGITSEDDVRWRSYRQPGEVRADMTLTVNNGGGAVFSVGSISWTGSLSHNGYDNDISRISENVLKRFIADPELGAR